MSKGKILYLTKYSRMGASSRFRSFQYMPLLEKEGYEIQEAPLFGDAYIQSLYSRGKVSKRRVIGFYWNRLILLFSKNKFDLLILEKELFPYMPVWMERLIRLKKTPYVVDYDDAIFHNYDMHPNPWVRRFLGKKIDFVMKNAACVIAGNSYLAARAEQAGAKKIVIIPTVVDENRYAAVEKKNPIPVVGWLGSPTTAKYLKTLQPVLERLASKYDFELRILGGNTSIGLTKNERVIDWSEETEALEVAQFDVGLMPLVDSPWEKGKCAFKLIQYLASGVPAIASNVGMNGEVIRHGENGFLAENEAEWERYLELFIATDKTPNLQYPLANPYTLQNYFPVYLKVVEEQMSGKI